jgi:hypothetical protein
MKNSASNNDNFFHNEKNRNRENDDKTMSILKEERKPTKE